MSRIFVGYQEQLLKIKEIITHPRESSVINIVGAYGSGRSFLLDHLQSEISNKIWNMPQAEAPVAIIIDGQGFVSGDRLMPFLAQHINLKLGRHLKLTNSFANTDSVSIMIEQLQKLSALDYPIVIMIDNFTRILTRIKEEEVQTLNQLKFGGIHYILVTDSRSVHEISPRLVYISDFLRTAQHVPFPPLSRSEALAFLQQKIDELQGNGPKQPCELSDATLDFIYQLAGGHPGLLYAVLGRAYFDHCKEGISDISSQKLEKNEIDTQKFLRYLPEDDSVKYYLSNLIDSVEFLKDVDKKLFLVNIAMENHQTDERNLLGLDIALHKRLNVMGFLPDPSELKVGSQLLQYGLLSQVVPASFSDSEAGVVSILIRARPGLVTFEQLAEVLKDAESNEPDALRRFTDSTIARIRKKLDQIPNRASFKIYNVRGKGFYMKSSIPFDVFLSRGTDVFYDGILQTKDGS